MKSFLLSFCLSAIGFSAFTQNTFQMERYLKAAFNDKALDVYQTQLDFLSENNYNFPLIHRVELRVGNETVTATPNQYRLRLSPSNPAEIKANKLYYKNKLSTVKTNQKVAFSDALYNRYLLIIDLAALIDLKNITENRIQYQRQLSANGNNGSIAINLKDLVSMHSTQSKLLLSQEEIGSRIIETMHLIQLDYSDAPTSVDSIADLVSVSQIKMLLNSMLDSSNNQNIRIEEVQKELALEEQELVIEKAEARSNIGYIQSNLDSDEEGGFNEKVGLQVGIRIPIVNPDKPKINRLRTELLEEQAASKIKLSLLEQKLKADRQLLLRKIARYEMILSRIKTANEIPVSESSQLEWSQVLALKNYQNSLQEERVATEKTIRRKFIEILNNDGRLVDSPVKNYLSKSFNTIQSN